MARRRFWKGFAAGAAAGAGAGIGSWLLTSFVRHHRVPVIQREKSIQIGRPVEEVFQAWSDLEKLPSYVPMIEDVHVRGNRSRWRARVGSKVLEWDAKVTQLIPNEALAWKSLSGPKHTGRINFSRLGNDTEVHVVMNYAPPVGEVSADLPGLTALLDEYLSQGLRQFKASQEGKEQVKAPRRTRAGTAQPERATGTAGPEPDLSRHTQTSRFGGVPDET